MTLKRGWQYTSNMFTSLLDAELLMTEAHNNNKCKVVHLSSTLGILPQYTILSSGDEVVDNRTLNHLVASNPQKLTSLKSTSNNLLVSNSLITNSIEFKTDIIPVFALITNINTIYIGTSSNIILSKYINTVNCKSVVWREITTTSIFYKYINVVCNDAVEVLQLNQLFSIESGGGIKPNKNALPPKYCKVSDNTHPFARDRKSVV